MLAQWSDDSGMRLYALGTHWILDHQVQEMMESAGDGIV